MSAAPDFYFALNAIFRHLHDRYGMEALRTYWRTLATEHYADRCARWRAGGARAIAEDWQAYFASEPGAVVEISTAGDEAVELDIRICPAIKHLRACGREIVPYFCEHCDHVCGAMADAAGFTFRRAGGDGACRQSFTKRGQS